MEKQAKPKNKILKFLPTAVSAVSFRSQLLFSPGRDKRSSDIGNRLKAAAHASSKGYSGPIIKMIPDEVRRKPKNGGGGGGGFDNQGEEPTSPKVSCIGQIKHKKKAKMDKSMSMRTTRRETKAAAAKVAAKKQESSRIGSLTIGNNKKKPAGTRRKPDDSKDDKPPLPDKAPPALGQTRRFASGRDTFANFDWTAQIAPEVQSDSDSRRDHIYSRDDDEEGSEMDDDQDEEYEEFIIPFSAPLTLMGGGEGALHLRPKKEINLWQRRTMNPPRPLELISSARKQQKMTP